jgi:hypothetical protein
LNHSLFILTTDQAFSMQESLSPASLRLASVTSTELVMESSLEAVVTSDNRYYVN